MDTHSHIVSWEVVSLAVGLSLSISVPITASIIRGIVQAVRNAKDETIHLEIKHINSAVDELKLSVDDLRKSIIQCVPKKFQDG